MPNMKSIRLKTKELQSWKVDVTISASKASWDHFSLSKVPLVIGTTSCYRKHLLLSRLPLLIGNTSCYRKHLLLSRLPLLIRNTSCYRKHLLLSRLPLLIGRTSCYRKHLLLSRLLLLIESTSCYRKHLSLWKGIFVRPGASYLPAAVLTRASSLVYSYRVSRFFGLTLPPRPLLQTRSLTLHKTKTEGNILPHATRKLTLRKVGYKTAINNEVDWM